MKIQRSQTATLVVALAGALALSACGKKEEPAPPPAATPAPAPTQTTPPPAPAPAPVSVASVDLGNAVDADGKKLSNATTTFSTKDTIYAAVATNGSAPTATLKARWTYQDGQLVSESEQTIAPSGAELTTFHISKADGWPTGNYKVEILLNGNSVATKEFTVQ